MPNTVYEGTLPADTSGKADKAARVRRRASRPWPRSSPTSPSLMKHVDVARRATSDPGDVAGPARLHGARLAQARRRPARRGPARLGRRHAACRCGSPIYARGDPTPGARAHRDRHLLRRGAAPRTSAISPPSRRQGGQGLDAERARRRRPHVAQGADGQARTRSPAWPPSPGRLPFKLVGAEPLAGLPRQHGHAARLGRKPGGARHLRPEPRRDRRDRAERVGAGGRVERARARVTAASTCRRSRSTAPPARSSTPRSARWSASPAAASPTRCSARCPPARRPRARSPLRDALATAGHGPTAATTPPTAAARGPRAGQALRRADRRRPASI